MEKSEYNYLSTLDSFSWMCPRCLLRQLPFVDCLVLSMQCTLSPGSLSSHLNALVGLFKPLRRPSVRIGVLNVRSLISSYEEVCLLLVRASIGCFSVDRNLAG